VVVGGTMAALALVERLSARHVPVTWFRPAYVGGGFSSLNRGSLRLPLGCRLIELSYGPDDTEPSLEHFVPGPAGHAPYQRRVRNYVIDLLDGAVVEVPAPQRLLNGRRAPDPYFTGDLSVLRELLAPEALAAVLVEARQATERLGPMGFHADPDALRSTSLPDASVAHHGPRLHELLIDPIIHKVLGDSGCDVAADLHNKLWAPLYWPKTVVEAAEGGPLSYRPKRLFHTDAHGGMGEIVRSLSERIERSSYVTSVTLSPGWSLSACGSQLSIVNGEQTWQFPTQQVALATSAAELGAAVGVGLQQTRVDVQLLWWSLTRSSLGCIEHVLIDGDIDSPIHRVVAPRRACAIGAFGAVDLSDSSSADAHGAMVASGSRHLVDAAVPPVVDADADPSAGERQVLCVEASALGGPQSPEAVLDRLVQLGVVTQAHDAAFVESMSVPAFARPTMTARAEFVVWHDEMRNRLGDVSLLGPLSAFGADVLNEQLFQALRLNEVWT
jgi:hypothetical protein